MKKTLFPFLFVVMFSFSGFASNDGKAINSERKATLKENQNAIKKSAKSKKDAIRVLNSVVKLEEGKTANRNLLLYCRVVEVNTICGIGWTGNVCTESAVLTTAQFHIIANWADIKVCGNSYWITV